MCLCKKKVIFIFFFLIQNIFKVREEPTTEWQEQRWFFIIQSQDVHWKLLGPSTYSAVNAISPTELTNSFELGQIVYSSIHSIDYFHYLPLNNLAY